MSKWPAKCQSELSSYAATPIKMLIRKYILVVPSLEIWQLVSTAWAIVAIERKGEKGGKLGKKEREGWQACSFQCSDRRAEVIFREELGHASYFNR